MNSDIRIMISFRSHRKRKKLKLKAGSDGVLALIDLWIGVATSRPTGVLCGWDSDDIEIEAGWEGERGYFVSSILDVGFLDMVDDCYVLHDWEHHQAWVVGSEDRSLSASKNQLYRWCLKKVKTTEDRDKFKKWYYETYTFSKGDKASGIVSVYEAYRVRNTPFLSSPFLSSPFLSSPNHKEKNTASGDTEPFYLSKKKRKLKGEKLKWFESFWKAFNLKKGKAEAADSWIDISGMNRDLAIIIYKAAQNEAIARTKLTNGSTPKWAQGWLSGKRWEDETETSSDGQSVLDQAKKEQERIDAKLN